MNLKGLAEKKLQYGDRFSSTQNQKKRVYTFYNVGCRKLFTKWVYRFRILNPKPQTLLVQYKKFSELEIVNSESVKPYGEQLDLYFYNFTYISLFSFFFSVVKERMKDCEKMCNITRTDALAKYRNPEK